MKTRKPSYRLVPPALLALVALAGCSGQREYVWYHQAQPTANGTEFHIEPGDLLQVSVWRQEDMSAEVRVRSDGFVSLPLIGDVRLAGLTPMDAAQAVASRASDVIREPRIVVQVVEAEPLRIGVLGRVSEPGMYELPRGSGLLQALARAGGLNEFADPSRIYVIRGTEAKPVRFTLEDLVAQKDRESGFALRSSDTVLVE